MGRLIGHVLFGYVLLIVVWVIVAGAGEPRVVEFNTPPQSVAPPVAVAQQYADAHGFTSCTAPADAELDDTFLATPVDRPTHVVEVDLDTALESAGKRHVLLACADSREDS